MSLEIEKKLRECFDSAIRDEKKGKKHKGLLITQTDKKMAEEALKFQM